MNRIKNDPRQPGETWAHYIKRGIGEEMFGVLNVFDTQETEVALNSELAGNGIYFAVSE